MKKIILLNAIILCGLGVNAQEVEYRRSSLTMVLIQDDELGQNKEQVVSSYNTYPFPDKYNEHSIADKTFNVNSLELTKEDYMAAGFYNDTLRTMKDFILAKKKPFNDLRYLEADESVAVMEPTKNELYQIYIDKYIKEKNLAKQTAASWFNRTESGSMDWELIKERGKYSASAEKLEAAESVLLDEDFLMDMDLIGNTYTVFNKLEFRPNEPIAANVRDAAIKEANEKFAGKPSALLDKAIVGIEKVYERTKEGYTVKCDTYLYQLKWDEDIAGKVQQYFFNNNIDPVAAWDTTSIFTMDFVGKTTNRSLVTFKLGEKRTEEEVINLQIKKTMDKSFAQLQKDHVQFRPVSPISSVGPVTAKIGLKEGLEPGQTFEILERSTNNLGFPVWKSVGKVSVDKKQPIWDNTFDPEIVLDEEGNPLTQKEYTTFKGGKKAMAGLNFLRLVK